MENYQKKFYFKDFEDLLQKYLISEPKLFSLLYKNFEKFYLRRPLKENQRIISFDFKNHSVIYLDNNRIIKRKLKRNMQRFDKFFLADLKKHKKKVLEQSKKSMKRYIIDEFFDGSDIVSLKYKEMKDDILYFKKDSHKYFIFQCSLNTMFDNDILRSDYNFLFKISDIHIKKDHYLIKVARKNRSVLLAQYQSFLNYFCSKIQTEEVVNNFKKSFYIESINPIKGELLIFLDEDSKKYEKLLKTMAFLFKKRFNGVIKWKKRKVK